jgi:hypothetical protein
LGIVELGNCSLQGVPEDHEKSRKKNWRSAAMPDAHVYELGGKVWNSMQQGLPARGGMYNLLLQKYDSVGIQEKNLQIFQCVHTIIAACAQLNFPPGPAATAPPMGSVHPEQRSSGHSRRQRFLRVKKILQELF